MNGIDLLTHARLALIDGRPEDALTAISRFHDQGGGLDRDDVPRARYLLTELAALAESGREGVVAARQHLTTAIEVASGVAAYDSDGQRVRNPADRRRPMRF